MKPLPIALPTFDSLQLMFLSLVLLPLVVSGVSDNSAIPRDISRYRPLYECEQCQGRKEDGSSVTGLGTLLDQQDFDITVMYTDPSGAVRLRKVKGRDLSASWVLEHPNNANSDQPQRLEILKDSFQSVELRETDELRSGEDDVLHPNQLSMSPVKLMRQKMRQERMNLRTAELLRQDKEADDQMVAAAIERSRNLDTTVKGKYSIWRRDYDNLNSDSTLKLMRDQIIMAKAYANIAKENNDTSTFDALMLQSKRSHHAIGEASSDAELQPSALEHAKAMGHILSMAKDKLYDCPVMARKFRAMLQSTEDNVNAQRKKSAFLIQLAAKTVPKPLHCLPLQLAADYFLQGFHKREDINTEKLEDNSLYHYAIFSDNVLATSVVVNSTVLHANEPEKHVFHIVTDKLNFVAMKMWFLINSPAGATIKVENIDEFKWLNSSYCSVLRQLESARMKEYYFKANDPSSLSVGSDNLKYRNPKYLSMLNHLRFYLPEVYPKLDKILFLDDDIVVQKDLTPLWSVDLQGMVNGAVETCKESFHRFDKYLNFTNPKISDNFDPNACGWAYGMNIFDLKEWKKRNITGIYHRWQDLNEDRTLWKLGSLPPGLITFYNLTHPLDRGWHVLGLGYDPALNQTAIEDAAVIHYNGNYKPWLDLAISKYKAYCLKLKESCNIGKWQEVLCQFHEMKKAATTQLTDPTVFPSILKACSNISTGYGKSVHGYLIKKGLESHTSISNSTMDLYFKSGYFDSALCVFHSMMSKDSVSWNILVYGYLNQGILEGLWWFKEARLAGFQPNISTLVLVIQACRNLGEPKEGYTLHGYMIRGGNLAVHSVRNSLLSMYAGVDMKCAHNMFDEMLDRDVVAWSVMIGGYVQCGEAQNGLQMFRNMISEGGAVLPDEVTIVSVLKACADLGDLTMGLSVHGLVILRGLDCDLFIGNSMVDMYSKCSDSDSAFKIFKEMPQRNIVSWNSITTGFVLNEKYLEALSLFYSMGKYGIDADEVSLVNILQTCKHFVEPLLCKSAHCLIIRKAYELNEMVLNSLLDAYAKCSLVDLARKVFDGIERRDVVSWSTMIAGFTHFGKPDDAIAVFQEMQKEQEKPNTVTIINLLEACSLLADLTRSKWAHGIALRSGFALEVAVGTAILDMYSKCGAIEASRRAFDQILKKNIVSWSAMIAAYGMNGLPHKALALHSDMKVHGLNPNSITTLCVLSACSHGGLVEEGISFFNSMAQEHGIELKTEHYSCLIDMLARAGKLNTAMDIIRKMPKKGLEAGPNAWGALLSACKSYRNSQLGSEAASRVLELEPLNSTGYLVASSLYAGGGLWGEAGNMRRLMKERGVKVVAGYSLVYVGNIASKFVAGDYSHSQYGDIHFMVELLHSYSKLGYSSISFGNVRSCTRSSSSMTTLMVILRRGTTLSTTPYGVVSRFIIVYHLRSLAISIAMPKFYSASSSLNPNSLSPNPLPELISLNKRISQLIRTGRIGEAREVFDALQLFNSMPERNVVSWNALITGFLRNGDVVNAVDFFDKMPERDAASVNALVSGLIQNGKLDEAAKILLECGNKDGLREELVHGYNTLIAGYGQRGEIEEARRLFDEIPFYDDKGKEGHKRFERNVVSWNSMIMCYLKAKDIVSARKLFDQMTELDTFSWNTMITGYVHVLDMEEASNLFGKMPYPDSLTWNSMISGFAEIGSLKLAMDYFERMPQKNLVSWNSIIAGYEKNENYKDSIKLFTRMQHEGEKHDRHTLSSILSSSSGLVDLHLGRQVHQLVTKTVMADAPVNNSLITMYSRCGAIKEARIIFNEMKQQKDVISWNAMIGGYAAHGVAVDALELFQLMKELNVQPTHITFIAVLNACAHAGLVKEGRKHFESMISEFGIRPQVEHYASLVDIISRQGQLEEALDLINNMPFKPDKAVWGAFLGGCKVHNNVHLAQLAAEALMRLEPESSAPYVLLHNMYADLGQWDNAGKIRLLNLDMEVFFRFSMVKQTLPRPHVTVQKKPIMLLEKQVLMLSFNQVHLSMAKDKLYDCPLMGRKFRAMFQSTEDNVNAQRKKSAFLIHLAAKIVSKPLHR
ncbi:hypothetical protein F8388_007886 [Cannabis sativa]|uniref:Pentatricopeptide repeat-containing protein n=2 Tax=Cannabis sativa TaxID=3483 RepID=A0A7J6FW59_CANSA|nr:hypothetical protein F8388_007886 [Cannabis sativa]